MKIQTLTPEDSGYESVNDVIKRQLQYRVDYDKLAIEYNSHFKGGIILVDVPQSVKLGNIRKTLSGRGLVCGVDYDIVRVTHDSHGRIIKPGVRPVAIKKKSETEMTLKGKRN